MKIAKMLIIVAGFVGVLALFFMLPGMRERRSLNLLHQSHAQIGAYRVLMGSPGKEYASFDSFKESYANKVFKIDHAGKGSRFAYWAREGFPYYWVLVVYDDEIGSVESVNIRTGW